MSKEIIHPTWSKDCKIALPKRLEFFAKTEKYFSIKKPYAYKYFSFRKTLLPKKIAPENKHRGN
jgi:hypothetical protein